MGLDAGTLRVQGCQHMGNVGLEIKRAGGVRRAGKFIRRVTQPEVEAVCWTGDNLQEVEAWFRARTSNYLGLDKFGDAIVLQHWFDDDLHVLHVERSNWIIEILRSGQFRSMTDSLLHTVYQRAGEDVVGGDGVPVGVFHVKGGVSPEQFEEFKRTYASALRSQPIEFSDQSQQLQALRSAVYDVPRGGASDDAPAWLVRLHRAACDVVGVTVVVSGDGVYSTPSPQAQPGSHAAGMYAAEGMNQAVAARLVGALESIAKSLNLEAPALPDLVHAVATVVIEKAELRAWHDRTLPQLKAALARIAELETGALLESRAAASPARVVWPSSPFPVPWMINRCDRVDRDDGAHRACGIVETVRPDNHVAEDIVSDTNREECQHGMVLSDALHIVDLHNQWVAMVQFESRRDGVVVRSPAVSDPALVAFKKQFDEKMRSEEEAAGTVASAGQVAKLYTAVVDQPPPVVQPDRIPVWENVISDFRRRFADNFDGIVEDDVQKYAGEHALADMRERDKIGRERYGTPLTTGNGRDHVVDAYQELLDAAVYLRAAWLEGAQVGSAYFSILDMVMSIRMLLDLRGVTK